MLIVNQYNVIPIKEKNKKAQLDSLELSSSKVPYIRSRSWGQVFDRFLGAHRGLEPLRPRHPKMKCACWGQTRGLRVPS